MHVDGDSIKVTFQDGTHTTCPPQTPVRELLPAPATPNGLHYLGALVNNDVVSLSYPLEVDSRVRFLTMADSHGWRIYRRTAAYLLAMAARKLYPEARLRVEHSLGSAFYCNFEVEGASCVIEETLKHIEEYMHKIVAQALPIERRKIFFSDAIKHFREQKQDDKYNLLRFRNPPKIVVYRCGDFLDLAHGPLADNTAAVPHFRLISYPPGFVIQMPEPKIAPTIPPFEPQPHLFNIFQEYKQWGRVLGVRTVGDLNEISARREIDEFIHIAEAFHEKKLGSIADMIAEHRDRLRWILIAGPSSSGKTTFAKRLAVHLRVNGLRPITISVDDYFVDREKTPRAEDGQPDYENIATIDLDLLNDHLQRLDRGQEVEVPHFNFARGRREYKGRRVQLTADQMVIIEGIHSLNPRLTEALPAERKFRIYVNALTQLNLDNNNRISTTDNRLVRRMVRDNMFRGNDALKTLAMWPNVRRGEKKWVFPFQQQADIAFNSALDYELAVLKPMVEPLLAEVKPYHEQYADARRLLELLSNFVSVPAGPVPPISILREFIGRSGFRY